jgi:membrane protein implicated in regulation of membrane protease activity
VDLDSPDTWQWIWLVAAVALALGELAVPGTFFVVSFAIGAAIAALASFLGASVVVGWLCFVGGTGLALAVLVPIGRRMNRAEGGGPVGATRLQNQRGVVLSAIPPGPNETGIVRIEREEWRAEHEHGEAVPVGVEVAVVRVDGTRVVVRPVSTEAPADANWPGREPPGYEPPEPEPRPPHFREPQPREMDVREREEPSP